MKTNSLIDGIERDVLGKHVKNVRDLLRQDDVWTIDLIDSAGIKVGHLNFKAATQTEAMTTMAEARAWLQNPKRSRPS